MITGMGVIAGSGQDLTTLWHSVVEGQSASRRLTRFDAETMPTQIGTEVEAFDGTRFFEAKAVRRVDLCHQFGIGAASNAVQDSGLVIADLDPDRVGIALGTSLGALGSTMVTAEGLRTRGYRHRAPARRRWCARDDHRRTRSVQPNAATDAEFRLASARLRARLHSRVITLDAGQGGDEPQLWIRRRELVPAARQFLAPILHLRA